MNDENKSFEGDRERDETLWVQNEVKKRGLPEVAAKNISIES